MCVLMSLVRVTYMSIGKQIFTGAARGSHLKSKAGRLQKEVEMRSGHPAQVCQALRVLSGLL